MAVYNYVRVGPLVGDDPVDDAPPAVIAAIEGWLEARGEPRDGVAWDVLTEPRLSLLVLHHAISSADHASLELTHVVAVPERRLEEVSQEALVGFFESLYARPLSTALPRLQVELAGLPKPAAVARVLDHFAAETHLEALRWGDFEAPERSPAPSGRAARGTGSRLAPLAAGLALLAVAALAGAALVRTARVEERLSELGAGSSPARTEERLARLERGLEELAEQEQASRSAWTRLTRSHADALSRLREQLEALTREASPSPLDTAALAPPQAEAKPEPGRASAPAAAPKPPAAGTALPEGRAFRVVARSARVRAGPSAEERTRGLLARGQRVVVTREEEDWLEIEPPPGIGGPAWIHRTVVEALEPAGEGGAPAADAESPPPLASARP